MTSQDLVRDWLRNVLQPYPSRDRLLTEVLEVLQQRRTLAVKTDAFTFDNGQTALLLLLHGTLPISYRGATYHIPIHLWIPHEYPRSPPLAFIVPTKDMGVRKGREVDPSGHIREEVVEEWWRRHDKGVEMMLRQLVAVFSATPPVYARPQAQAQATQAPQNAEASSSRPPPPPARPDALPQYRPAPTPPAHPPQSRQASLTASPPVPDRPRQASGQLPQSPPHVPQRPFSTSGPPLSPVGGFAPPQGTPPPQSWQPQQPVYANGPVMPPGPPGAPPYPMAQPQQQQQPPPLPQHPQPPQPPPQLHRPPPDLLSSPEQQISSLPSSDPPLSDTPLPPSKPPPPSLLHLHSILLPHLNATLPGLVHSLQTNRQHLLDRREDLVSGEPAIRDEMARLEAVKKVCDSVGRKMEDTVSKGEARVAELEAKGEVSVDEVVCGISIAHNQLVDLVAEDNAIEDTIFHMTRALDAERIDLDRFVKSIRSLAREQYMKRALVERILDGMGQKESW